MSNDRATVLESIRTCDTDPDDDKATPYAKALAVALLSEADPLPKAAAAAWEDGSVFVFWSREDTRLHLKVPASAVRQPYMYYRRGEEYGIDHELSPAKVAGWLRWFVGTAPAPTPLTIAQMWKQPP